MHTQKCNGDSQEMSQEKEVFNERGYYNEYCINIKLRVAFYFI